MGDGRRIPPRNASRLAELERTARIIRRTFKSGMGYDKHQFCKAIDALGAEKPKPDPGIDHVPLQPLRDEAEENEQYPLCDRVGILERLGGRLDTQLQSTWTVASRADQACGLLKARVDEWEKLESVRRAALDEFCTIKARVEELGVEVDHNSSSDTENTRLHHERLDELEAQVKILNDAAILEDDSAEVEAFVKAALETRIHCGTPAGPRWDKYRVTGDALIAKRKGTDK